MALVMKLYLTLHFPQTHLELYLNISLYTHHKYILPALQLIFLLGLDFYHKKNILIASYLHI